MPRLSKKLILEFQEIIKKDYGKDISFEEASEIANGSVGYFDLLAKICHRMKTEENHDKY